MEMVYLDSFIHTDDDVIGLWLNSMLSLPFSTYQNRSICLEYQYGNYKKQDFILKLQKLVTSLVK
ncbi:hypothetical protein QR98_0071060 [Sarcoptes scabiei]|uniref:Uncharacterized protein n=1 Tax=Sarcoptes scabiei TaxID=52283 RepID=A0A132AC62_SARSC|nr:hypothetical protein QR98_0071060 [Sarcoptes scabiei]